MYLLGYDIGSSSVKVSLMDAGSGEVVATGFAPQREMEIVARESGWAEQEPRIWWENVLAATREIKETRMLKEVEAIGLAYQMHGLVVVDKNLEVLRPSIIWCDSRAVEIGKHAFQDLGQECLKRLLNAPGNFTASKLKWVMENEPEIYEKIYKIMLPGDYIAMKMTGELTTTPSGLSEGIMWDFREAGLARFMLDYYGISDDLIPEVLATFSKQGSLTSEVAGQLGLKPGIPVSYRAGDQPNNALALNVLNPGEVASTAGTSGVIYAVGDKPCFDSLSRYNTFVHVNHTDDRPRFGNLFCLNGTGILYSWLKHNLMTVRGESLSYGEMDRLAGSVAAGAEGLSILPYGNGAERILENRNPGASIHGLEFNIHTGNHILRAAQEGIVFALNYGLEIMRNTGIPIAAMRAGNANMFKSALFGEIFATLSGVRIELYDTDGSQGAARGAGIGAGFFDFEGAFRGLKRIGLVEPNPDNLEAYRRGYERWQARSEEARNSQYET